MDLKIGVLALQGAFQEHAGVLERLGIEPVEVRLPRQLGGLAGLIIPGGESTTIGKLLVRFGLVERIVALAREGLPIFGTCAGLILLAGEIEGCSQSHLGLMDITVKRNAYGRQLESFEADLGIRRLGERPFRAVFIRAPQITRTGPGVSSLAWLDGAGTVAAEEGNLLVTSFHPELTPDDRLHAYFADKAARYVSG